MLTARPKALRYLCLAAVAALLVAGGFCGLRQAGLRPADTLDHAEALHARAHGGADPGLWTRAEDALVEGARALPGDRRLAPLAELLLGSPQTAQPAKLRSRLAQVLERGPGGRIQRRPEVARNLAAVLATGRDEAGLRRALGLYQELIRRNPGDPGAHLGLGRCLLGLGRLAPARQAAFKAVKLAQAINNVYAVQRAKNSLGQIYLAQGQHRQARLLFKNAILRQNRFRYHRTDGTHWGCAYQGLGELYSTLGRASTAALDVKLDEDDHRSLFSAALAHYHRGNTGLSLAYVERALGQRRAGRYQVLRGFLLLFHKNYPLAQKMFERAREARPAIPGPRAGLGHLMIIRKDYSGARVHLQASLERWPAAGRSSSPFPDYHRLVQKMARMGLGWIAANQNRHTRAIQQFELILAKEPDDLMGLLGRGNSLLGLGQVDRAQEVFQQVLRKHPQNRYALAELAVIRMSKGSDAEAERGFKKALEQDSQSYTCPYEGLGLLYLRQGKLAQAKKNLRQAIRINPEIEFKKFNALARIYIGEGRHDEAAALLKKSIENFPHDPEAARLLTRLRRRHAPAPPGPGPAGGTTAARARPAAAKQTVVSLGLWMPVDLVVSRKQGQRFDYNDHQVQLSQRVVRVDGRPVGLDLVGLGPAAAASRVNALPRAAASVRVDAEILCDARVVQALNRAGHAGLALTIPDATAPGLDLGCLARLGASEMFLHLEQAGNGLGALAALKNLRELKLGGRALGAAGLAHLAGLSALRVLSLASTSISDEGLAQLARLHGLEQLNLWSTRISDAGLAHLEGLSALRRLELGDTAVSDRGLVHLGSLRRLTRLGLGSTRVAGPGLVHLKSLGRLETLELWYTDLSDAGLAQLSGMRSLRELQLWYTRVTDAGMVHLGAMDGLRQLGLGGTVVGDVGLAQLARLGRLQNLDLWGTRVTDAGLAHLSRLTALEDLNLGGTRITDAGLARLGGLVRLLRLSLWGTRVTGAGLVQLAGLVHLSELELFATRVGDPGLEQLVQFGGLRFLELSDTRVTDAGLRRLLKLTRLRELELGGTRITDAGLAQLGQLRGLRELGLANNPRITNAGLAHLSRLTGLRELVLGNTGVTDQGLRQLRKLVSLELLELGGTSVTDHGLAHLSGLARLTYLGLGATRVTGAGLSRLSGLKRLRELELWFTGVDDSAMARLRALTGLCELELAGTAVTDAGLASLRHNHSLRTLEYGMTRITRKGIRRLRQTLPALEARELASF